MLLSIIIPIYHAESYLRECLGHLLSHSLTDVELVAVVCDDGYDKSADLCADLFGKIANAKVIVCPEEGLSVARNIGLSAATSDYVYFIDGDDILLEPGFSELKNKLVGVQTDVFVCKFVLFQQNGMKKYPSYTFPKGMTEKEAVMSIYADLPDTIWNVWRYICRRNFLLDNNLYFIPGLICEDVEWTPRMLDAANSISFIDAPIYRYSYNHFGQLSKRALPKRIIDINKTVAEGVLKYADKPYGDPLCYRLIRESLNSISEYCRYNSNGRKKIRGYITECIKYYSKSPNKQVRFFLKTYPIIPLYVWSVALLTAKKLRGRLKWLLGANKIRRFSSYNRQIPLNAHDAETVSANYSKNEG